MIGLHRVQFVLSLTAIFTNITIILLSLLDLIFNFAGNIKSGLGRITSVNQGVLYGNGNHVVIFCLHPYKEEATYAHDTLAVIKSYVNVWESIHSHSCFLRTYHIHEMKPNKMVPFLPVNVVGRKRMYLFVSDDNLCHNYLRTY